MSREDKVNASDHTKLKTFLQGHGFSVANLTKAIGSGPAGRKKKDLANDLKRFLRTQVKS